MFKKLLGSLMAATVALGALTMQPAPASAGHGGRVVAGVAAGIIGLGVLGAIAGAHEREHRRYYYSSGGGECYPGPERCGYSNRRCFYNDWGDYVCRGGQYRCWRETICD
jgi:hypothetical protein